MRALPLLASTLALAGCVETDQPPAETVTPDRPCRIEAAAALIGQPGTQKLATEAIKRTGARAVRWIWPGSAVTMDYRYDRLNIELDAEGRVKRFGCG